jgi:hypothetical protein
VTARPRRDFVSAAEARTVAEAKRVIRVRYPHARDITGRRANPMRRDDGFIVEYR